MNSISKRLVPSAQKISPHSNFLPVGRVAWSIYALLKLHQKDNKQTIAMPSFVCQSVVASAIAANWEIKFLDVQIENGLVSSKEYLSSIEQGVDAILFVHLLGNKNKINNLQKLCTSRDVLFIEDSAQYYDKYTIGQETNLSYVRLVSFSHSKIIDAGAGGLVFSNDKSLIKEMNDFYDSYSFRPNKSLDGVSRKFKSKFYELKDRLPENLDTKYEFKDLITTYLPLIDTQVEFTDNLLENIIFGINNLDKNIGRRKKNWANYRKYLDFPSLTPLLDNDSIPWRASFRIEGLDYKDQHKISNSLRELGYDVSNWYLPAHWYIEPTDEMDDQMQNTLKLSQEIIQFWVDRDLDMKYFESLRKHLIPHLT